MNTKQLIDLVMASFASEQAHRLEDGYSYLHPDFRVTEMNIGPHGELFRSLTGDDLHAFMAEAFRIRDRQYHYLHILADEATQTVMVEFIETYHDPITHDVYRTPLVAVCEIRDGKIYRTRHYVDDRLSGRHLSPKEIKDAIQ